MEDIKQTKTSNKPKHYPAKALVSYIIVGLLSGILGAGFYGNFITQDDIKNTQSASSKVTVLEQSAIIDLVKKVSPSVVSITSSANAVDLFGQTQQQTGAGTGMIVTEDGLILTNKHVIEGADELSVITADSKEPKPAKVIAQDPSNDVAFIKIEANGLKPVELGDSAKVEVGQSVVAIGNALGQFQNSVTSGIISGRRQSIQAGSGNSQETLTNIFQTDAAINPGNSGGPLVNIAGQVIGINTAVAGEGAQNIGFAIPINDAKNDLESVRKNGKVIRPFLGVRYVPTQEGAKITKSNSNSAVVSGSPAEKAGLKEGDVITKINDTTIDETTSLSSVIGQYQVGQKVTVTYLRDGETKTVEVSLAQSEN